MIRILITDDHAVVRHGLRRILSEYPDMSVEGEAGNAEELLELLSAGAWDVLILDISMPGRSGFDVFQEIHRRYPGLPVLFFSLMPEEHFALRALRAGAAGYITKESPPEELVAAIRKAGAGKRYVSPALAERLAVSVGADEEILPHEHLSNREFQIFRKIALGSMLTEIASELFLSPKTVTTYRARILEKLGLRTNAELTRYAIEHRLI